MAVQKNWEVDQNTTFSFEIAYQDHAGAKIDLTNATAKLQVRDTAGGRQLAFTLTSPSGGIIIDGPSGIVKVKMTPTQTNKLFYPKSAYDLMIIDSNGNKTKLLEGFLTLSRSVTV